MLRQATDGALSGAAGYQPASKLNGATEAGRHFTRVNILNEQPFRIGCFLCVSCLAVTDMSHANKSNH